MVRKHFLFIFFIIFVVVITCSCVQNGINTIDTTSDECTSFAILSNSNDNYEIVSKTICTNDRINFVKFQIPQFLSKNKSEYDCINTLIYEQSKKYIAQFGMNDLYLCDETKKNESENYKFILDADYNITLVNEKNISIVFKGLYNVKTEPHPNNFSFSMNINFETKQLMNIDSRYELNEKFVELLLSNGKDWLVRTDHKAAIAEYFNSQLLKQALADDNTYFYITENKFGIIINNLPYALGNYCTYEIPNEYINKYETW